MSKNVEIRLSSQTSDTIQTLTPNTFAMKSPITHTVRIAEMMQLTPAQAVVLPACIAGAARKVGMNEWSFSNELLQNNRLRNYVAGVVAQVASEMVSA